MKLSLFFTAVVCADLRIDDVPTRMAKDVQGKFNQKTNRSKGLIDINPSVPK